eukprot:gene13782-4711_t
MSRRDKKKVVKIVLPNAIERPKRSAAAQDAKASTMVTSTPRTAGKKVPKSKKKRENELKEELAKIEMEKSLLQDQYSQLLKHHMLSPNNHSVTLPMDTTAPNLSSSHRDIIQRVPEALFYSNLTTPKSNSTKDLSSSIVFKELEKTISGISEKLSFPAKISASEGKDTSSQITEHKRLGSFTASNRSATAMEVNKLLNNGVDNQAGEQRAVQWSEKAPLVEYFKNPSLDSTSVEDSDTSSSHSHDEEDVTLTAGSFECEKDSLEKIEVESYTDSASGDDPDSSSQSDRYDDDDENKDFEKEEKKRTDELASKQTEKQTRVKTVRFEKNDDKNNVSDTGLVEDRKGTKRGLLFKNERSGSDGAVVLNADPVVDTEGFHVAQTVEGREGIAKIDKGKKKKKRYENDSEGNKDLIRNKQKDRKVDPVSTKETPTAEREDQDRKSEKQFYQSPNGTAKRPLLDAVSQLSVMRNSDDMKLKPHSTGIELHGIKPGYAATQITALSYLFKELTSLLSDRINSEESRLLNEIDHMIGLLPFLINNLDPNLQTEISLAVQPLRVENSDLRRQLRIANQRIRDFEINVQELQDSLKHARKHTLDQSQIENLRHQMQQDEATKKLLMERISGLTKNAEDLKQENLKLVERISVKDAEIVRQKQLWQKEKTSVYTENDFARNRLESFSLSLQAKEKETKILKVSLTQSEAEVVRLTELNRDLRNSVERLLQDVNFKDSRPFVRDSKPNNLARHRGHTGATSNNSTNRKAYQLTSDDPYKPETVSHQISNMKPTQDLTTQEGDSRRYTRPYSDQESDFLSSTTISDLTATSTSSVKFESFYSEFEPNGNFDDQISTLTCDSQEFRTNLANLSSNIKQMQQSLCNAKRA